MRFAGAGVDLPNLRSADNGPAEGSRGLHVLKTPVRLRLVPEVSTTGVHASGEILTKNNM
jgi:hypothetical protein